MIFKILMIALCFYVIFDSITEMYIRYHCSPDDAYYLEDPDCDIFDEIMKLRSDNINELTSKEV